jgi:hypothetical protein
MNPARLVFLDETWATTNMARRYGRAPRGERAIASVPHGHWKTSTFVAGLRDDDLLRLPSGPPRLPRRWDSSPQPQRISPDYPHHHSNVPTDNSLGGTTSFHWCYAPSGRTTVKKGFFHSSAKD